MARVAVVFHSGYGHTQRMAQAVADGAQAQLVPIDADGNLPESGWDTLAAADAIIMGSPTYMGSVSWKDKIFGGFTNSANVNGDKHSTLHYFMTLAMQHGGIWVGTGLNYHNTKASQRGEVNYLASSAGPMAQTPGDASPFEMNAGDLETARLFGKRVAEVAAKFHR